VCVKDPSHTLGDFKKKGWKAIIVDNDFQPITSSQLSWKRMKTADSLFRPFFSLSAAAFYQSIDGPIKICCRYKVSSVVVIILY
jgi:hypothetical protein